MEIGLDRLPRDAGLVRRLSNGRLGVLAHPASVDRALTHIGAVLAGVGLAPALYFGPEHGYGGEAQDMIGVADARDRSGVPVRSLYGDREADLVPTAEDLERIDVLLVDLQDVGARYYTFVWTAVLAMRAAARAGKRVVVLDRPNPLGGAAVEGRSQLPEFRSFVGLEPICTRHGLTIGEIVAHRARLEGVPPEQLEIVPVRGLPQGAHATAWDRPFVLPSPNMPTYETALVYPGGCLLEGTNLSEGRGTTRPFEIFGAPFLDGERLARAFHELALPGVRVRPLSFRPTFHKFCGQVCGGVQVHPTDPATFQPVLTYLALIALAHHQAPDAFRFRTERYEFIDHIPAFDLLTGDAEARTMIVGGAAPLDVARTIARLREGDADLIRDARSSIRPYESPALD